MFFFVFFFSSRRRHTRFDCDWSSDVCSSDLDVNVFGTNYAMRIWMDPAKMEKYALMPSDLVNALNSQNAQVSAGQLGALPAVSDQDRKSTRLNSSHSQISYAVFCLKKKKKQKIEQKRQHRQVSSEI